MRKGVALGNSWVTVLTTLVSAATGWLLHELSDYLKARGEEKRALGLALAQFLDVRERLRAIPHMVALLRKRVEITPYDDIMLRRAVEEFLPNVEELQKRYNAAIDGVAGNFPLLAFRLRSKDVATPLIRQLRTLSAQNSQGFILLGKVEDELVRLALPKFDEIALELARRHSWRTWWQVKSLLKSADIREADEFFSFIEKLAKEQGGTTPGTK